MQGKLSPTLLEGVDLGTVVVLAGAEPNPILCACCLLLELQIGCQIKRWQFVATYRICGGCLVPNNLP
jgi:hypothetical protein